MNRYRTIDLCRGLLFIFMMNTHALTIARIPQSHWLFSDFWLPNGWATVVFVVLSGYGVGFIFSIRSPISERDAALRYRAMQILAVMLVSNSFFAILRQIAGGNSSAVLTFDWWLGFLTLDTEWTISGVLLPTALVLLCGPAMIRWTQRSPWLVLGALAVARIAVAVLAAELGRSAYAGSWSARFFILEGLSGFPVVPFVINGCIGIWLGVQRHQDEVFWRRTMLVFLSLQLAIYLLTLAPHIPSLQPLVASASAVGKFAWMFVVAHLVATLTTKTLAAPIELLGKYALGSFVMHRVFLQALEIGLGRLGRGTISAELHFLMLFVGALFMTWALCVIRQNVSAIDAPFRRLAL
jgi:hypothetical protein